MIMCYHKRLERRCIVGGKMKLVHLSDLHIGKRVNGFSMVEDQKYILAEIAAIVERERPDAVLVAGDVYDKSVPPAEAVQVFDDFLFRLSELAVKVFVISGNHDSPERLAFGNRLMDSRGVYIASVYCRGIRPVVLTDTYGKVNFYMLPFIKPAQVKAQFAEEEINSYTDAVRVAVRDMNVCEDERNVLITHQFVTGATGCDSEEISVGGSDNVDADVFDGFDYVALGHLHGPQNVGRESIRYSGTPLKYSFSECRHQKSVTVVEMAEKGRISIRTEALSPRLDMREIRGTYLDVTAKSFYEQFNRNDYLRVILTDEEDIPEGLAKLRVIYPNIMNLEYDNARTRSDAMIEGAEAVEEKTPFELFAELFELQNNRPLGEEQADLVKEMIEQIWGGENETA